MKSALPLQEDLAPRIVEVPADFKKLLNKEKTVKAFFEQLSYSHQREYVNWIIEAKKPETRTRRILKAIDMMKEGKKGR